jgi:hypothetical protein
MDRNLRDVLCNPPFSIFQFSFSLQPGQGSRTGPFLSHSTVEFIYLLSYPSLDSTAGVRLGRTFRFPDSLQGSDMLSTPTTPKRRVPLLPSSSASLCVLCVSALSCFFPDYKFTAYSLRPHLSFSAFLFPSYKFAAHGFELLPTPCFSHRSTPRTAIPFPFTSIHKTQGYTPPGVPK